MEYQAALKSCVQRETSATTPSSSSFVQLQNHLLVTDDHCLGVVGNEDIFPIDDLLVDFSNEGPVGDNDDDEGFGSFQEKDDLGSVSWNDRTSCFFSFSSQLDVPDDDLAELEWVSHFVHDSVPEFPPLYGIAQSSREPEPLLFPTHVPVRARSKRPRVARREHPSSSSSDSSSTSSGNSSCLSFAGLCSSSGSVGVEQVRKRKRGDRAVRGGGPEFQRRCTHCQAQRTPQWRAGPLGPKTLCNACGVRYKSGRLLPEYRPACSPTFSVEKHSNSHRKVLEMRRRVVVGQGGVSCLDRVVV